MRPFLNDGSSPKNQFNGSRVQGFKGSRVQEFHSSKFNVELLNPVEP
jgi:hypothetical protein